LAPEPTFIKDRCPTYHSRIFDDNDIGSKNTRSPLINKILNRKPKKEKKKKKKKTKTTPNLKNSQETTDEQKIVEKTDKATEAMPENETEEVIDHLIEQTECQDDNGACVCERVFLLPMSLSSKIRE
jgi:hypothetical protein